MGTDIVMGTAITSAAISPLVIGVILVGAFLIGLNITLGVLLIARVIRNRIWEDLNCLDRATRQRLWEDPAGAGPNFIRGDSSTMFETASIGGWRRIG
jgi:hypothetical protein